jgi:hypothetical protein
MNFEASHDRKMYGRQIFTASHCALCCIALKLQGFMFLSFIFLPLLLVKPNFARGFVCAKVVKVCEPTPLGVKCL